MGVLTLFPSRSDQRVGRRGQSRWGWAGRCRAREVSHRYVTTSSIIRSRRLLPPETKHGQHILALSYQPPTTTS